MCAEIEIHEAHKDSICKRGQELVDSEHPEADQVAERTQDLQEKYGNLKKLADDYKAQLDLSLQAKQVRLVFQSRAFWRYIDFVETLTIYQGHPLIKRLVLVGPVEKPCTQVHSNNFG